MATLKGQAVIWGIGSISVTGAVAGMFTSAVHIQNLNRNSNAQINYVKNYEGDTVAGVISDVSRTLSITVVPYHTSVIADARTNAAAWLPAIGTSVSVSDITLGVGETWMVTSSALKRTNEGVAMIDLELINFTNSIAATIAG